MLTKAFIEDLVVKYAIDYKNIVRIYVTKKELDNYNKLMTTLRPIIITPPSGIPQMIGHFTSTGAVEIQTTFALREGTFGIEFEDSPMVEVFYFEDVMEELNG